MTRRILTSCLVLCAFLTWPMHALGQSAKPRTTREKTKSKELSEEEKTRIKAVRAFAVELVSTLADDARNFKDDAIKVRTQAGVAAMLWDVDRDRSRILFDRAWDAAETVDKEGLRKNQEEKARFLSGRGGTGFIPPVPNLRGEVLRLASLHDSALANGYLEKINDDAKRQEDGDKLHRQTDPTIPSEAVTRRLQLARQLLENGDVDKSLYFAEPALDQVTAPGIIYLVLLRQKNPASADRLFSFQLGKAGMDAAADATSVSLLSSYVLTPSVLVTSTRDGLRVDPWTTPLPQPQLAPVLTSSFFNVAGQILLRPLSPADLELTSAGLKGTSFTIQRLLPEFTQYSPELGVALQGKLTALNQQNGEAIPESQRSFLNAGFSSRNSTEPDDLAGIDQVQSTNERNRRYANAARAAALRNELKARSYADKIENPDLRKAVRTFVDVVLLNKALEKRETENALDLIRTGELSPFHRVWAFAETARLMKPASAQQAMELINEARNEAGHISVSSNESAEAWIAIARRLADVDQTKKWEIAIDVTKSINKAIDFTGEQNTFTVSFSARGDLAMMKIPATSISLGDLFTTLGSDDVYRAADLARNLNGESPRSVALMAAARAAFEQTTVKSNH